MYKLTELKSKPCLNLARHLSKVRTSLITSKIQARNQRLFGLRLPLSRACQQQNLLANKLNGIDLNPPSQKKLNSVITRQARHRHPESTFNPAGNLTFGRPQILASNGISTVGVLMATLEVFQGLRAGLPQSCQPSWLA